MLAGPGIVSDTQPYLATLSMCVRGSAALTLPPPAGGMRSPGCHQTQSQHNQLDVGMPLLVASFKLCP